MVTITGLSVRDIRFPTRCVVVRAVVRRSTPGCGLRTPGFGLRTPEAQAMPPLQANYKSLFPDAGDGGVGNGHSQSQPFLAVLLAVCFHSRSRRWRRKAVTIVWPRSHRPVVMRACPWQAARTPREAVSAMQWRGSLPPSELWLHGQLSLRQGGACLTRRCYGMFMVILCSHADCDRTARVCVRDAHVARVALAAAATCATWPLIGGHDTTPKHLDSCKAACSIMPVRSSQSSRCRTDCS